AARDAHAPLLEVEILLDTATALDWMDEWTRSKALVDEAVALASATSSKSALVEARLLMAQGRSLHRFSDDEQAAKLMREAVRHASPLGDDGYETGVIALLQLGYMLATLGRLDESEEAFATVIPLCESQGDLLHLGAAYGNRTMLWACRNEKN